MPTTTLTGESLRTRLQLLRAAARDSSPVTGFTHQHYKYPARFSPTFVSAAIQVFSRPGDLVLDPYMGGGTTIVEALASNRRVIGCDINELAVFVARAKVTALTREEASQVEAWALAAVQLGYHDSLADFSDLFCPERTRNLNVPRARALKKIIAFALAICDQIESHNARTIARCVLLSCSQWALNGRKSAPSLDTFREKLVERAVEMAEQSVGIASMRRRLPAPLLLHLSASDLPKRAPFVSGDVKADLVVTSPPYPGVHVLYHRWQVDGRKETPAPYWIANCMDGQSSSFYNFGNRQQPQHDDYFASSLLTLQATRAVMRQGAVIIQMVAFSDSKRQLPRYLENMCIAGFDELKPSNTKVRRIWRDVPRRTWHADLQGRTGGAREVVFVHEAV